MGAVRPYENVVVEPAGRSHADKTTVYSGLVVDELEVGLGKQQRGGRFSLEDVAQIWVALANDEHRVGFGNADLLPSDFAAPVTLLIGVVGTDVGHHRHVGIDDVGGIETPENTNLNHGNFDSLDGEDSVCGRGQQFEVAGRILRHLGHGSERQDLFGEQLFAHGLAIDLDPFSDRRQVRARIAPNPQTLGLQESCNHRGRRTLAVRAGDMNRPKRLMGVPR